MARPSRRGVLKTAAAAGAVLGAGEFGPLLALCPTSAAEAKVTPELVRFSPEIEPIVRLIEETPREKCAEAMLQQLRTGLPYRVFLAALYLAAVRAAMWHGAVHGFDHNAYLVHAVHQLSLDMPVSERLLPTFYALNSFKGMQEAYKSVPRPSPLSGPLPAADRAVEDLHAGMKEWDPERAERAIVAMVRCHGASRVMEPLWHYAGRDWRFIGHLAILVANSERLLQTIGWQHAEHVLRYVVSALAGWPKEEDDLRKQPYAGNRERTRKTVGALPADWAESRGEAGLTRDLVAMIREGKGEEACDAAAAQLAAGKARAGAVWDAVHLAAGELVLRSRTPNPGHQTNGDALHANTVANALHYAFRAGSEPETRLLLVLQAVAWTVMFRDLIQSKGLLTEPWEITRLEGAEIPERTEATVEAILATRSARAHEAARMAFALGARDATAQPLFQAARRLLPLKATGDPHDIKFPVAICEDCGEVSPPWRPHLLAAAVFSFRGSDRPDHPALQQVREAVRQL
jgi:hypothetical protein